MAAVPLLGTPERHRHNLPPQATSLIGRAQQCASNRQIADRLILSLGTVKKYLNTIFSKLEVESRTQAGVRARELDLL